MSDITVSFRADRTIQKLPEFRYVYSERTTTEPPKLQQAWRDLTTGEILWYPIQRVIVSDEEFRRI